MSAPEASQAARAPSPPEEASGEALAPRAELEASLRLLVLQSVRSLSLWLGLLFILFVPFDLTLTRPETAARTTALMDVAISAALIAIHLLSRREAPGPPRAHALAAVMALFVLPYFPASLLVTGQSVESAGLALWQIGCALVFLSWPWLVGLLALSNLAWVATVAFASATGRIEGFPPDWQQYAFVLMGSTVIALVAHGVRLRTYRRLESLRLLERNRRIELERAQEAARQVDALRKANEIRSQFIHTAAHELATPLTPVALQVRLLRGSLEGQLTEPQRSSFDILERNLERLQGLLADVLESARLQSDRLPVHAVPMDLASTLEAVAREYRDAAAAAGLRFVVAPPPPLPVRADPRRIHQVLANLVSNAVKFTPRGGLVEVRAFAAGDCARVEVQDTGVGIAPEEQPLLFQPFSRLAADAAPGSGLGLSICRAILERQGGRVGCHSAGPGQGATFWFELPLSQ